MKKILAKMILGLLCCAWMVVHASDWQPARSMQLKPGAKPILVKVTNWGANNTISLNYKSPKPQLAPCTYQRVKGQVEKSCVLGNAVSIYKEGEPVLPAIVAKVVLPYGHTVDQVAVSRGAPTTVVGKHFVEFGPAPVVLMPGAKVRQAVPSEAIYSSEKAFPTVSYKLVTVQRKRGVSVAFVQIYPVTYSPKSGLVQYYSDISVKITTKPSAAKSAIRVRLAGIEQELDDVENSQLLSTYKDNAVQVASARGLCNPQDEFKWVMVTSEKIKNSVNKPSVSDLEQLRKSQGLSTKIMTIEEVLKNYDGVDNPEKLRKFIIDAYNNWKTEFVLLGGDVSIIPLRQLYCYASPDNIDNIDSDLYYMCLDGNYNYDNDGQWGEADDGFDYADIDLLAEVYVGRISAEDEKEMSNQIFKIKEYETVSEDDAYLRKALLLGEKLGWGGITEYSKASLQQIKDGYDTLKGFAAASEFTVDGIYEEDGSYGKTDVLSKINGTTYSIFHHYGHSNHSYGLKLRNGDESRFTNEKYIFGYSQGCLTGQFSKDCIAERFTTQNRKGFWGLMFNTNLGIGYKENLNGPSQILAREFWDAYFGEDIKHIGKINQDAHEDVISIIGNGFIRWSIYETNILADPATIIRGKIVPAFVTVTSPNGGEKWEQGRTFDVLWNDNIDGNVKIELLKGTAVDRELAASEASDGKWTWNIPTDFPTAADYKIRVTSIDNNSIVDESFEAFAIEPKSTLTLTAPNGGETVEKGAEVEVTWTDNLSGNVNIDLCKDSSMYRNIVLNTESDGSYKWKVSDVLAAAADYTVRITAVGKEWLFVESAAPFSIKNPVVSTFPWVVNFDHWEEGAGVLGNYWEQVEGEDDLNWTVLSGPTPSGTTGPNADRTTGNGKYIYTEASGDGSPNKKFFALTPILDLPNVNDFQLGFWYHMRSDTNRMGDLYVDIHADGAWQEGVVHISGHQDSVWLYKTHSLSAYADKQIQLRFRGVTGTDFDSDMAIDDVRVGGPVPIIHGITHRMPHSFGIRYYGSRIHFQIPKNGNRLQHILITLFNLQGKKIATLVDGRVKAGFHTIPLTGSGLQCASGLYLCKLETKGFSKTINVLIKK